MNKHKLPETEGELFQFLLSVDINLNDRLAHYITAADYRDLSSWILRNINWLYRFLAIRYMFTSVVPAMQLGGLKFILDNGPATYVLIDHPYFKLVEGYNG